jgi:hypothetical protein
MSTQFFCSNCSEPAIADQFWVETCGQPEFAARWFGPANDSNCCSEPLVTAADLDEIQCRKWEQQQEDRLANYHDGGCSWPVKG